MISEDITLDSRVHARIIGARGKGIRKIMDEFKVRAGFAKTKVQNNINVYRQEQVIFVISDSAVE